MVENSCKHLKLVENGRKPFLERPADGRIPSKKTANNGTHTHTHTQIHEGHHDLETDSALWANSVKICIFRKADSS